MSYFLENQELISSTSEYSGSKEYLKIFYFISKLIKLDSNISPSQVYGMLVDNYLINPQSNNSPIDFGEALAIDNYFFGKGGDFWLDAYKRPFEYSIIKYNEKYLQAQQCGIFTCNLVEINPDNLSKYKYVFDKEVEINWSEQDDSEYSDDFTCESESVDYQEKYLEPDLEQDSEDNLDFKLELEEFNDENREEKQDIFAYQSKQLANKICEFIQSKLIANPNIKPWEMTKIIYSKYPEILNSRPLYFSDAIGIEMIKFMEKVVVIGVVLIIIQKNQKLSKLVRILVSQIK